MRWIFAPLLLLALALAGAGAASGRVPDRRCYPRHSSGMAASTRVRVYDAGAGESERILVCDLVTGHRTLVAESPDEFVVHELRNIRLAGRFVAFTLSECIKEGCGASVMSVDARTGQIIRSSGVAPTTELALSTSGAIAWLDDGPSPVLRSNDGAHNTVRDTGHVIDGRSLAFAEGGLLYWTHDGEPRSAQVGTVVSKAATAVPRGSARCFPHGARAVAASTRIRVYEVQDRGADTSVACDLRSGRRTLITSDDPNNYHGVGAIQIRGTFVAYSPWFCVKTACFSGSVRVVDAGNGRRLYDEAFGGPSSAVREIVLAPDGSVGWLNVDSGTDGPQEARVARCDARGCVVLGTGPANDIGGLALSEGSQMYWTTGDGPHSTDLR